jgi:penicillin-binding protein-related factor A (putative recombinase)
MSSNIFQQEVGRLLKDSFIVSYRLDDAFKNKFGGFQVTKKPYDFYGATKSGTYFGAEAKKVKSVRFPMSNLYEHQRNALQLLTDNNCYGFLFINWRVKLSGTAIWITYNEYIKVEEEVRQRGIKSLKPTDFNGHWFLERVSRGWSVPKEHKLRELL